MDTTSYYEVLNISPDASEEDIRKAYRRQALLWHPDKNQHRKDEAESRFKVIAEAYEVLSDGDKRRTYDMYGKDGLKGGIPNGTYAHTMPTFTFVDPFELFAQIFGREFSRSNSFHNDPFGSPFFPSPFGGSPFGRPFDMGFGRPIIDNNFAMPPGMSSSSSSSSFSSFSSVNGGRGNFVQTSTQTRIVNGVRTTVTTTTDAQGNTTTTTETSNGGRRTVTSSSSQSGRQAIENGPQRQRQTSQFGRSGSGEYSFMQQQQQQQQQQQMYSQPQQTSQEQYYYSNSGTMHQDPTADFDSNTPTTTNTTADSKKAKRSERASSRHESEHKSEHNHEKHHHNIFHWIKKHYHHDEK